MSIITIVMLPRGYAYLDCRSKVQVKRNIYYTFVTNYRHIATEGGYAKCEGFFLYGDTCADSFD